MAVMLFFQCTVGLLVLFCLVLGRPQEGGAGAFNFFQGGKNPMQQYASDFEGVSNETKLQMALLFLNGFETKVADLKTQLVALLANYPKAQADVTKIFDESVQQQQQAFQTLEAKLNSASDKQAIQNFVQNDVNNDQITMMQGCQDFMSLMRSLSDEGRAELIQVFRSAQMGGGAGGNPPTPMPTVNSAAIAAAFGMSGSSSASSVNMCNMAQQMSQKLAQKLQQYQAGLAAQSAQSG